MAAKGRKTRWSRAAPTREESFAAKRLALIQEAGRAFGRKGFHNTSLNDVAKMLNVTKPALYYYIKNKQEILYECHASALDIAEKARQIAFAATEDPLERIGILFENYIELLTTSFGAYGALVEPITSLDADQREIILRRMREFDRMCRSLVEQAIKCKVMEPCDPRLAIAFFMGAINNITRWYSPDGPRSGREIAKAYVGFIVNGLRGPNTKAAEPALTKFAVNDKGRMRRAKKKRTAPERALAKQRRRIKQTFL